MLYRFPIKKPEPDFYQFLKVLNGEKKPDKVHFAEFWIDEQIKEYIIEKYFKEKNVPLPDIFSDSYSGSSMEDKRKAHEKYYAQIIDFRYRMGYCYYVDGKFLVDFMCSYNEALKLSRDTALYSKGLRAWAEEGTGMIKSFNDFERFPWDRTRKLLLEFENHLCFLSRNIPDGMKIVVTGSLFEQIMEWLLGYENFFYLIHDQPDLIESVVNKVGQIMYDFYQTAAPADCIGALLLSDDLGYKTSSIISIKHLRKWFFPWYKKYSLIAHKYNKQIWHHCCGYKYDIMEDLIFDIELDAIHSFEDTCCPVIDFKKEYGNKIAILGGVDVDKLARWNKKDLSKHIKNILDVCMDKGRFALGSGNSITNYIPVENYLTMLETGLDWNG